MWFQIDLDDVPQNDAHHTIPSTIHGPHHSPTPWPHPSIIHPSIHYPSSIHHRPSTPSQNFLSTQGRRPLLSMTGCLNGACCMHQQAMRDSFPSGSSANQALLNDGDWLSPCFASRGCYKITSETTVFIIPKNLLPDELISEIIRSRYHICK